MVGGIFPTRNNRETETSNREIFAGSRKHWCLSGALVLAGKHAVLIPSGCWSPHLQTLLKQHIRTCQPSRIDVRIFGKRIARSDILTDASERDGFVLADAVSGKSSGRGLIGFLISPHCKLHQFGNQRIQSKYRGVVEPHRLGRASV